MNEQLPSLYRPLLFLVAMALTSLTIANADASPAPVHYACSPNEDLLLQRTSASARVSLGGHTYALQRARSSIGDKYLSRNAALIIDGASVIFVTDDNPNRGVCVKTLPLASTR